MFEEMTYPESVNNAFLFIASIAAVIIVGVTAVMIYFVVKYHRSRNKKAVNIPKHYGLEIFWTVAPVFLAAAMFWYGYVGYADITDPPDDAMRVTVYGQMWKWTFEYENGLRKDTLYVPLNRAVALDLKSLDVNHSFYIPTFRFKMDVLPNKDNETWFKAEDVGEFDIACAEYCGLEHSYMYSKVVVMPEAAYKAWFEEETAKMNASDTTASDTTASDTTAVEKGASVE
ncbi:MAG: cytochrome c oxidase subunit II [Ignavibacteriales bacterium]|nr:cytochrome c oxidase subunit II [Ignavibacteriales bacterium]